MDQVDLIFALIVLVVSVVIHEVSHGYAAELQGDPTARLAGRLTMNPLPHIDPMGSIFIPLLLVLSSAPFVIGWAKPVPVNPYNLRNGRKGEAIVAAAGPLSNISIAIVFGLLIRFGTGIFPVSFIHIAAIVVIVNIVLAIFNLVPIPPLDGSKIIFSFLPHRLRYIQENLERFWILGLLFFVFVLWPVIVPIISALFGFITGFSL